MTFSYFASFSGININPDLLPEFSMPFYLFLDLLRLFMKFVKLLEGELLMFLGNLAAEEFKV